MTYGLAIDRTVSQGRDLRAALGDRAVGDAARAADDVVAEGVDGVRNPRRPRARSMIGELPAQVIKGS